MDGIKIEVTGNIARVIERPARITAGTVGLPIEFSFDNQWEGLSKTAVFRAGRVEKISENLENETIVPWEVTENPNVWLSVGVYGVNADGSVAIPTIWANVCVICYGANPDGDVSTAPTLPVWQRLWNAIGNLLGLTTNAKGNLVEAINEVNKIALAGGKEPDVTLTQSGKPADAKAVGDALNEKADAKAVEDALKEKADAALGTFESKSSTITADNSGNAPLHNLKLYGKTVQNGTPTPDAPVPLESVGDGGSVAVTVLGKNLLQKFTSETQYGITITTDADGTMRFRGTSSVNAWFYIPLIAEIPIGEYTLSFNHNGINVDGISNIGFQYTDKSHHVAPLNRLENKLTSNADKRVWRMEFCVALDAVMDGFTMRPQLEVGNTATAYEEPKAVQTLNASTPDALCGIPVISGGNYTDEKGQQYIADYRDWERGVDVQMIGKVICKGDENWNRSSTYPGSFWIMPSKKMENIGKILCSHATWIRNFGGYSVGNCTTDSSISLWLGDGTKFPDVASWKAFLAAEYEAGTPVEVLYLLDEPDPKPIPEEELAAYRALHTNYPNTTVYNDGGAYMEAEFYSPSSALPQTGGRMSGSIDMCGNKITYLDTPTHTRDAVNLGYVQQNYYPATESADHSGCYYRTVGGVTEWVNPPMITGEEYRTTERYMGKPVYVRVYDCGEATNGKAVAHGLDNYTIVKYDARNLPFFFGASVGTSGQFNSWVAISGSGINIYCGADAVGNHIYCRIYYTKE